MSFGGSLRLAASALWRRGDRRLLSSFEQTLVVVLVIFPALSLAAEGCGLFVVISLATGHSGPMTLGSMFGMPDGKGWLATEVPTALALGLLAVRTVMQPIESYILLWISQTVSRRIRTRVLQLAAGLPAASAGAIPSGELAGILMEHGGRSGRAITATVAAARLIFAILIAGVLLLARDPGVVIAAVLAALPGLAAYAIIGMRTSSDTKRVVASYHRANDTATEGLRSLSAIKAVGGEAALRRSFDAAMREVEGAEITIAKNTLKLGMVSLVVPFIAATGAVLYVIFVREVTSVQALTAMLLPTAVVGARIASTVTSAVETVYQASVQATSLVPVDEVIDKLKALTPSVANGAEEQATTETERCVVLRDLGYRLGNGVWLFRHLDERIAPGAPLILRGKSGTGKSTLASLIAGANAPTEGQVCHVEDGLEKRPDAGRLNYLSQDPAVVAGSIRKNLLLGADVEGNGAAVDEALLKVLRTVELWDELEPKGGLDAEVYEGGRNLSGGQIRRLGLARLLARDRAIWIFDEAVASLDVGSASVVERLIRAIAITHATMVITHDTEFWLLGAREVTLAHAQPSREEEPLKAQA